MREVSVVIPFYQREPGILSRALASVMSQEVPDGWSVKINVVDDGSPCLALGEVRPFQAGPHGLRVVRQDNQGVAAARNRALAASTAATLIAFLDSDDIWPPDHLARAIRSHEAGYDLTFTDNGRPGHHGSHVRSHCSPDTGQFLAGTGRQGGVVEIPTDYLVRLILKEFPTQASTVVYRRAIAPHLRFDTRLKNAGEDVLFFAALAAAAARAGFDLDGGVECGQGLNMYFAHLSWDSPKFLAIKLDQLLAHQFVARSVVLSPLNKAWNDGHIAHCRAVLAFHLMRSLVRCPGRVPVVVWRLLRVAPGAALLLPLDMIRVAATAVVGAGRPDRG